MAKVVDEYSTVFPQLERMGKEAAIPESHKAPMFLASVNPSSHLEVTVADLRRKDIADLPWDYVATKLIDEYNAKHVISGSKRATRFSRKSRKNKRSINNAGSMGRDSEPNEESDSGSDVESTVNALAMGLKNIKSGHASSSETLHCQFFEKLDIQRTGGSSILTIPITVWPPKFYLVC